MAKNACGVCGAQERPTSPVLARLRREDALLAGGNADRLEWLRTREFFAEHSLADALQGLALAARQRPTVRRRAAAAAAAAASGGTGIDKPRRPHTGSNGCNGCSGCDVLVTQHLIGLNKEKSRTETESRH